MSTAPHELQDRDIARFVKAYWTVPASEREKFLKAMEERARLWEDDQSSDPARLVAVCLTVRRGPDDPMRNVRPPLKVVRP